MSTKRVAVEDPNVLKPGRNDSDGEENDIVNIGGRDKSAGEYRCPHYDNLVELDFRSHFDVYVVLYDWYYSGHDNPAGEYLCSHCDDLVEPVLCSHFDVHLVLDERFHSGHDNSAGEYLGSDCDDLVELHADFNVGS